MTQLLTRTKNAPLERREAGMPLTPDELDETAVHQTLQLPGFELPVTDLLPVSDQYSE